MKRIVYGMSFTRSQMLERLEALSKPINKHVMKCVIYKDSLHYLDHWCGEIATWLNRANGLKSKVKLDDNDYFISLFTEFGEDEDDAKGNLSAFLGSIYDTGQYPEFEITDELVSNLYHAYQKIMEQSLEILESKEVYSIPRWKSLLLNILG